MVSFRPMTTLKSFIGGFSKYECSTNDVVDVLLNLSFQKFGTLSRIAPVNQRVIQGLRTWEEARSEPGATVGDAMLSETTQHASKMNLLTGDLPQRSLHFCS